MKVMLDNVVNGVRHERIVVDAKLIEDCGTTVRVRLADGNVITRKKKRDLPEVRV